MKWVSNSEYFCVPKFMYLSNAAVFNSKFNKIKIFNNYFAQPPWAVADGPRFILSFKS